MPRLAQTAHRRRHLTGVCTAALLMACASAGPRFDSSIQAGFMRSPMRHLETEHVELYYPEPFAETAKRIVGRLERCVVALRTKPRPNRSDAKMLVYLTQTNFNNAYVQSEYAGSPLQMVIPLHSTLESDNFNLFGTVNQGNVACHEATHYVQDQQTHGFWWYLNAVGGPLVDPSQGLERWFTEGLAVWNEGHIDLKTGRPNSPFWHGMFEAAMDTRPDRRPRWGDLDLTTRDLYQSGAYLTSSHFIDYLIRRFGEDKLWELIDREGGAVVPEVGIGLLFRAVYGETLLRLIDDFGTELSQQPLRVRPANQQVLVSEGASAARIAVSPADGSIAEISRGYDYPVRLVIRDADGDIQLNLPLTRFLPGRDWVDLGVDGISGLRFSSDGRLLFFVGSSLSTDGADEAKLYALEAKTGDVLGRWDLFGFGGDLAPDNLSYVYVEVKGDTENLVRLDIRSGQREQLTHLGPAISIGAPAFSPDGKRIAFALWNGESFDLALREEDGRLDLLTQDGHASYSPRWIDPQHLVFLRDLAGRWQVHQFDLTSRTFTAVTNVPHLALDPMPRGPGEVVFLNRDGVQFTIDSAPLNLPSPPLSAPTLALAPPPLSDDALPSAPILSDRPAGAGEGLLLPLLHAPFVQVEPRSRWPWGFNVGLLLSGSDKLGIHNYAASVSFDTLLLNRGVSFNFDYIFHGFAPVQLEFQIGRSVSVGVDSRSVGLSWSRSFWDVPVSFSFAAADDLFTPTSGPQSRTTLIGPRAGFSYGAFETTAYGGVRRSLRFGLTGAAYGDVAPKVPVLIGDLRPTLGVTLPLPILKRHSIGLDFAGRALLGQDSILALGGFSPGQRLLLRPNPPPGADIDSSVVYSPGEYVRGYEDFSTLTSAALVGTAVYQYTYIIDRGWTAFLWILPSVFVNQLNLEVFGTEALYANTHATGGMSSLRAVGASFSLATTWGQQAGISLTYQFTWRFDQRLQPMHLIWLGF